VIPEDTNYSATYSTTCFLAGIAIGVGIGMLLAPSSGADAREYIRERARDWRDRAGEFVEEGKHYLHRQEREGTESAESMHNAYDERRS
jgi:gas vesicle protein